MALSYNVENDTGFIVFDHDDSKVNILSGEVLKKFETYIDEVGTNKTLRALVIVSNKKDCFIAGADIKEIEKIVEPKDGKEKAQLGQDIFNKLEDLPIPTIAVINGVALGGGCELALACKYRVASFNPKVKIGLPEVNLGFVPGFGGTYRLPRIVGLAEGLKMILSGRPVDGAKALKIGLVDKLVPSTHIDNFVFKFIDEMLKSDAKTPRYGRKKLKGVQWVLEKTFIGRSLVFSQSRKSVMKLSKGFYPAPLKAIEVVQKNCTGSRTRGLDIEAEAFGQLAITGISKNLVNLFYMSEHFRKFKVEGTDGIKPDNIDKCGILGAGIMGGGIAQLLSSKRIWSRLKDLNHDALGQGYQAAATVYKQAVKKRKFKKSEAEGLMGHITGTLDYSGFNSVDMVIEAVVEDMKIKKAVFKELSEKTPPQTILATNTSALSVAEMAEETKDPSKVIGIHFFNPVHRMPLIEVITTPQTSKETIVTTLALVKKLGKTPIVCKDSCGFIVNRILLGYINEAGRLLEETGQMEAIDDTAVKFGMPMGPLRLSDEVGLDVGIKVLKILEDAFGDRFKPGQIFEKVYEAKLLGKKAKKGFYVHGKNVTANPQISRFINGSGAALDRDDCIKSLIYVMINEAARCLQENIVDDPAAIDVGMIFGTGFPPFRGGLLRYADNVGIDNIVETLQRFQKSDTTDRFQPAEYLLKLKEKKKTFYGD